MEPLVSIIIPTYNRASDLERALRSVLAQTYPTWEALIVDNYSSDNTEDVLKIFDDTRIKLFKIHNHGVIAASRNLGIKYAQGEYIAFLDSDDWWASQKLESSVECLKQGADVVYHDLFLVSKPHQKFLWRKARTRDLRRPVLRDLILNGNALNNSSVVVRKKLLDQINGLSEERDLIAAEDYDAWLRISKCTEKFKRIDKTLGYYWEGGGNTSNPTCLLKNVNAIEARYADLIQDLGRLTSIDWITYVKGMSYYRMGCYEEARKYLASIGWFQAPFFMKIKSQWILMLMNGWCPNARS